MFRSCTRALKQTLWFEVIARNKKKKKEEEGSVLNVMSAAEELVLVRADWLTD